MFLTHRFAPDACMLFRKIGAKTFRLFRPFSRIRTISICYAVVYLISLGIFSTGLIFLMDTVSWNGESDWETDPNRQKPSGKLLLFISLAISAAYWLMSVLMAMALIKIKLKTRKETKVSWEGVILVH